MVLWIGVNPKPLMMRELNANRPDAGSVIAILMHIPTTTALAMAPTGYLHYFGRSRPIELRNGWRYEWREIVEVRLIVGWRGYFKDGA